MFTLRSTLSVFAVGFLSSLVVAAELKFEIYKDKSDEFRWRLKDGDTVLGTSGQGYKAKADAKNGIERIQKDAKGDAVNFEIYEDKEKKSRWRAKVKNGNVIASSASGYEKKEDCEKAIKLIKEKAEKAEVVDESK